MRRSFSRGSWHLVQRTPRPLDEAVKGRINGRHEQFVFIFEIKIDSAIGHPGTVGNFRHAGVKKTMLSNDFDGRIQDALVLIGSSIC